MNKKNLQTILDEAITFAKKDHSGQPASYIPELANVNPEITAVSVRLNNGEECGAGDCHDYRFTLQSTAKVVSLIGLLEEFGQEEVFKWINVEPTSASFSAIDYGDRFSHLPSNPMINAGAITLCSYIPGADRMAKQAWIEDWMHRLFNSELTINHKIYTSELDHADRNRSIAYLLRSDGVIKNDIETTLKLYTALCSFETTVTQAAYLPMLLANAGKNETGKQIISPETVKAVVSIMATCGLYNESGLFLLRTGMPAKSGVSGLILALGVGIGGVAAFSPRITCHGGSVRGHIILNHLANTLGWHFALMRPQQ